MKKFNHLLKTFSCLCAITALLFGCTSEKGERNSAPVLNAQSFQVQFAEQVSFDISAEDPNLDELTFSIVMPPDLGRLEHNGNSRFTYYPNDGQILPTRFTIAVTDGKLTSQAVMEMLVTDNHAFEITHHLPEVNEPFFSGEQPIIINFNSVSSLPEAAASHSCDHVISLVSVADGECVPVKLSLATNPKQLIIEPSSSLAESKRYSITVDSSHRNFVSTQLAQGYKIDFTTAALQPVINEFVLTDFESDYRWVELYNGTAQNIMLSDYQIDTQSLNNESFEVSEHFSFKLPKQSLAPGEYFVVQNAHMPFEWKNGFKSNAERFVITGQDYLYWTTSGYIELTRVERGQVVDVVKFGDYQSDIHATSWQGENIATDGENIIYRLDAVNLDGINANAVGQVDKSNWRLSAFPTMGAINDVICEQDEDKDGIPDCNEQVGTTYAGLPLYQWGARQAQKDIFVEVDYMLSDDLGTQPHIEAVAKVAEVFERNGFAIHFDVGDLFILENIDSNRRFNLGGGNAVPFSQTTHFSEAPGQTSVLSFKSEHQTLARDNIFHYVLFANSQEQDGSAGSSGYAEIDGDDAVITLGGWGLNNNNEASLNYLVNIQSATLIHELGHNFGLLHGGLDAINNKPNHISSMNYNYQLSGIPSIGKNEGDRLLQNMYFPNEPCAPFSQALVNGPEADFHDYIIGYSHGQSIELFESGLDERIGFGHQTSSSIDYNCDGEISESRVSVDLDLNGYQDDIFTDYNEWQALKLDFNTVKPFEIPPILQQIRDFSIAPLEELLPTKALLDDIKRAGE